MTLLHSPMSCPHQYYDSKSVNVTFYVQPLGVECKVEHVFRTLKTFDYSNLPVNLFGTLLSSPLL